MKKIFNSLVWVLHFYLPLTAIPKELDHPRITNQKCLNANKNLFHFEKTIELAEFKNAYNPSIVKRGDGYTLFFRFDETREHLLYNHPIGAMTYIGVVDFNEHFEPVSTPYLLDLKSPYCEDPRVVAVGGKNYLFFNDLESLSQKNRVMKMAVLDPHNHQVEKIFSLSGAKKKTEKNWTPVIKNEMSYGELFYIYSYDDLSLVKMDLNDCSIRSELVSQIQAGSKYPVNWLKKYGFLRGGAPVFEIDGEYWSFFHSTFKTKTPVSETYDRKDVFYVMGVMTLKMGLTNQIQKISEYPLLYESAFESKKVRCHDKWIIYPSGCCYDFNSKEFVLSLGENDGCMKILKVKLEKLLQTMVEVK